MEGVGAQRWSKLSGLDKDLVAQMACNAGNPSSIPGLGRSPGEGIDRLPTPVFLGFPGGSDGKESACNAGDLGSVPGWGRSPGGGHGNPLQYSCLENPMDRGAWWATVHGGTKSQTGLKDSHTHTEGRSKGSLLFRCCLSSWMHHNSSL